MTIVGLLSCGGKAERLHGLPKYLLPVPAGTYLLDELCRKLHTVKNLDWVYVASGLHNSRLVDEYTPPKGNIVYRSNSPTVCAAICDAKQHTGDSDVIYAMPDSWWSDETILGKMAAELSAGADITVGAWMTLPSQRNKLGMLDFSNDYKLRSVDDKPEKTKLIYAWGSLGWSTRFWDYIKLTDTHLGIAINAAIAAGLTAKVICAEGSYFDLGTIGEVQRFYSSFKEAVTT